MALGMPETDSFMIGAATVMLGPKADLFNMRPATHALGVTKNATVTMETTKQDLTAGFPATIVDSQVINSTLTASFELYEISARTATFATGGDGSAKVSQTANTTTSASITSGATTVPLTSATGFTSGTAIVIVDPADVNNYIMRTITAVATNTVTVAPAISQTVATGAVVYAVNNVSLGKPQQTELAMVMMGTASNGDPLVYHFPRVKVTKGFTMVFNLENHANFPFEVSCMPPTSTDTNYQYFVENGVVLPGKVGIVA